MNPKHKKHEENYLKSHHNQLLKTNGKEKNLKTSQRKNRYVTFRGLREKKKSKFIDENNANKKTKKQHLQRKTCHLRILYPVKMSFKFEVEIRTFTDKQKLREFLTSRPELQNIIKETTSDRRKTMSDRNMYLYKIQKTSEMVITWAVRINTVSIHISSLIIIVLMKIF